MSTQKVAFLLPSLQVGGAERVMSQLAVGFVRRGLTVDFVLVRAQGPFLAQLPPQVRVIDLNLPSTYYCLPALIRYMHQVCPQVIISALDLTNLMAIFSRRISGSPVKLAIRLDNMVSVQRRSPWKKKIERVLLTEFYPWSDEIIAVAKSVADDFSRYTGIPRGRLRTIYNPIILPDLYQRRQERIEHPWFSLGMPPVILSAGRLTYQKNFELLIEAFHMVSQSIDTRLVILGEGEKCLALKALVDHYGLEGKVSLPGNVSNPYSYMARAKAFVLPSRYEGLPTVLVEAMACDCPVVSTDCPGGAAEILNYGEYGHLTTAGDPSGLAEAILEVMQGHGRGRCGFAGRPRTCPR